MENLVKKIAEGLDTEEEEKQTLAGVDDSLNSFKEARVRLRRMISNSIIKIEVLANGGAWIMSDSIKELQKEIVTFRDDRNWKQFHNPKDLAISITLEAAELLEVFQWSGADLSADKKLDKIKEELADVLIYSYLMANDLGLSIDEIVRHKLQSNDKKYPVEKSYGNSKKYTEL